MPGVLRGTSKRDHTVVSNRFPVCLCRSSGSVSGAIFVVLFVVFQEVHCGHAHHGFSKGTDGFCTCHTYKLKKLQANRKISCPYRECGVYMNYHNTMLECHMCCLTGRAYRGSPCCRAK